MNVPCSRRFAHHEVHVLEGGDVRPALAESNGDGSVCCILVYDGAMAIVKKARPVRRSVSLRPEIDSKVRKIAQHQKRSANRVLENLIETGLQAKETEKRRFLGLVDRLRTTTDSNELRTIKDELARLTFGS